MEARLDTPLKFRHPCYEALVWFAARDYLQEITGTVLVWETAGDDVGIFTNL